MTGAVSGIQGALDNNKIQFAGIGCKAVGDYPTQKENTRATI